MGNVKQQCVNARPVHKLCDPKVRAGISILVIILAALILFRGHWFSSEAQNQIEKFLSSNKPEIRLVNLFPWTWEYLCTTGDYSDIDIFENIMGRRVSVKEKLLWLWYGAKSENEDNFIFEDAAGQIRIYVYDYLGKPPFHGYDIASRGRCIKRSENVLVQKTIGDFGSVIKITAVNK